MQLWPPVRRIVVLGDSGVGKTALVNQLCHQQFVQAYNPTIEGTVTRTQILIDDQSCALEVLDTAGSLDLEDDGNLEDGWIQKYNDGIVLVYDVTSRKSFDRIEYLFQRVLEVKGLVTSDSEASTQTLPIMIVGNKTDELAKKTVSPKEGAELAEKLGCMFIDTSAKNYQDVFYSFSKVVEVLVELESLGGSTLASFLSGGSGDGCCTIM
ncbi:putative small G-protein Ras2 [Xylariaceae sp. AK1471]|nr:putative small G-protein Ras2 [Xylariaceae sp. AK1471]